MEKRRRAEEHEKQAETAGYYGEFERTARLREGVHYADLYAVARGGSTKRRLKWAQPQKRVRKPAARRLTMEREVPVASSRPRLWPLFSTPRRVASVDAGATARRYGLFLLRPLLSSFPRRSSAKRTAQVVERSANPPPMPFVRTPMARALSRPTFSQQFFSTPLSFPVSKPLSPMWITRVPRTFERGAGGR